MPLARVKTRLQTTELLGCSLPRHQVFGSRTHMKARKSANQNCSRTPANLCTCAHFVVTQRTAVACSSPARSVLVVDTFCPLRVWGMLVKYETLLGDQLRYWGAVLVCSPLVQEVVEKLVCHLLSIRPYNVPARKSVIHTCTHRIPFIF